jgi:WD40 repeat protein
VTPRRRRNPRPYLLVGDVLVLILGAVLGIATNVATSQPSPISDFLTSISAPLLVATVILLVVARVVPHYAERARSLDRVWDPNESPYPGLDAFGSEDAAVFFGRDSQIQEIIQRLRQAQDDDSRFLLIVGTSGVGKSSVIHAGVLPALGRLRGRWAIIGSFRPSTDPAWRMATCFANALTDTGIADIAAEITNDARRLGQILDSTGPQHIRRAHVRVLVIDQLEEIFTVANSANRAVFISLLEEILASDSSIHVLGILRSEFLTDVLSSELARLVRQPITVGPLDRNSLFQVIEGPAKYVGLTFSPGLTSRMVDEVDNGDALPLLAYVLQELYLQVGKNSQVTNELYERLGGVNGALSKQADSILETFGQDSREQVLDTLLAFVTLDGREPTRRQVDKSTFDDRPAEIVAAFLARRILASYSIDGTAFISASHEALFRAWTPLRQAIEVRAENLRRRGQLERWAREWDASGRLAAYLLTGDRLAATRRWVSGAEAGDGAASVAIYASLNSRAREYLEISYRADQAAMMELSASIAAHAMALVKVDPELSVLLALAAIEEAFPTQSAYRALATAVSACKVRGVLRGHHDWIFDVAYSPVSDTIVTGSRDGQIRVWERGQDGFADGYVLGQHADWVTGLAWSPDGTQVITCSRDRSVRLWSIRHSRLIDQVDFDSPMRCISWDHTTNVIFVGFDDGLVRLLNERLDEVYRIQCHAKEIRALAYSATTGYLATGSTDGAVGIWDTERHTQVLLLRGHSDWIHGLAWSPVGRELLIGSRDRTATLWSIDDGSLIARISHFNEEVRSVKWSPDGTRTLLALHDGSARIWDSRLSFEILSLRSHEDWIRCSFWPARGDLIVTGSQDRTARLWSSHSNENVRTIETNSRWIHSVSWAPSNDWLASGSGDGHVRIWRSETTDLTYTLEGHTDEVLCVSWSPEGSHLASASADGSILVWETSTWTRIAQLADESDSDVTSISWRPDRSMLASCSRNRQVQVWDADDWELRVALHGHDGEVLSVDWSPDGSWLASSSRDRTVRVWNTQDWTEECQLSGHSDDIFAVSWSPDGRMLATGSRDRTIMIWQRDGWTTLATLVGHEDEVLSVKWSPDGKWLASASRDRTWRIWSTDDWQEFPVYGDHGDEIRSLTWSALGNNLATGGRDSKIKVWTPLLSLEDLVRVARSRRFRELTEQERRIFLTGLTAG